MSSLDRIAVTAGLKAVELQMPSAFAFLSEHPLGFPGGFGWLQVSKDMYPASPTTWKLSGVVHEMR